MSFSSAQENALFCAYHRLLGTAYPNHDLTDLYHKCKAHDLLKRIEKDYPNHSEDARKDLAFLLLLAEKSFEKR